MPGARKKDNQDHRRKADAAKDLWTRGLQACPTRKQ